MKKLIDLGNNIVEVDKILGMSVNSYRDAGPTNCILSGVCMLNSGFQMFQPKF